MLEIGTNSTEVGDRLLQSVDKDVCESDAFGEMHRALLQTVQGYDS